jgi:hypothetical protein
MSKHRTVARARWSILALALTLVVAACGDDDDDDDATGDTAAAETTAAGGGTDTTAAGGGEVQSLTDVCPNPLVIQTDWYPEPDHGYTYQAAGVDGTYDTGTGTYSGTLQGTDLELQIRAGGPFIGFGAPTQQVYEDPDIFMGYVDTGDAIRNAATQPMVGVFAPYEKGPQIIMWDPEAYPDVETIEDIGETAGDGKILYFAGGAYMDYLVGKGIFDESQIDSNYDGSPGRFVAEGDLFQQGFATNELFKYENVIEDWMKPVSFVLVHDSGFEIYQSALSVRPEAITERADCLAAVVPIFQQAAVDYLTDPGPVNRLLDQILTDLNDPAWPFFEGVADDASARMRDLGLVSNGDNSTIGDFDDERTQALIDEFNPILEDLAVEGVQDGLTAAEIQTNEFLDMSIGLP